MYINMKMNIERKKMTIIGIVMFALTLIYFLHKWCDKGGL